MSYVVHSLEEALALYPLDREIFVIGGGEIYAQALPLADRLYMTRVHRNYHGDTYFLNGINRDGILSPTVTRGVMGTTTPLALRSIDVAQCHHSTTTSVALLRET